MVAEVRVRIQLYAQCWTCTKQLNFNFQQHIRIQCIILLSSMLQCLQAIFKYAMRLFICCCNLQVCVVAIEIYIQMLFFYMLRGTVLLLVFAFLDRELIMVTVTIGGFVDQMHIWYAPFRLCLLVLCFIYFLFCIFNQLK